MGDTMTGKPGILLIEHENEQRTILREKLEKRGFFVVSAENGQEGLELWSAQMEVLRIVITDIEMPVVDGFEVIKTIREQEDLYTYIMALTTLKEKHDLLKGLRLGTDDFITKPIIDEELQLRLEGALKLLRLQDHRLLVAGLAEVAAERSGESGAHLQRTKGYCRILADDLRVRLPELDLSRRAVEDVATLSVLHDIGKNGIPDGLLNKRGTFSEKEYEIIKDHTIIGGNMLKKLSRQSGGSPFLLLGHEIAVAHHEKWDGTGYPFGLKGEEIPLAARIMALADVYDAMLSRRPYKDPFSLSYAEMYIEEQSGSHFDPEVVQSYLDNRGSFIEVHNRFPEPEKDW